MDRAAQIRQSIWTVTSLIPPPASNIFKVKLGPATNLFLRDIPPAPITPFVATNYPMRVETTMTGSFEGDKLYVSQSDACQTNDFKQYVEFKYGQFPDMWFGDTQGITYKSTTSYMCYVPLSLPTIANDQDTPFEI
jgi:hypothetical protein